MEKEKLKSSIVWTVVTVLAAMCIVASIVYDNWDTIKGYFNDESQEVIQEEQDFVEDPKISISSYLDMRSTMREEKRVDSVFLSIPDVVLVDILRTHGTDLWISDIVAIYESNNATYNKVLSGARSQKYLEDSIQKIPKDTAKTDIIPK